MTKFDLTAREFEALPPRSAFAECYRNGAPQVVWTRLVADLETPVSAALKLSDGQPMSCLLESVEGGAVRGRYSIIGLAPDIVWRAYGARAEINQQPQQDLTAFTAEELPTLQSLRALLARSAIWATTPFGSSSACQTSHPTRWQFPTACLSAQRSWWCLTRSKTR